MKARTFILSILAVCLSILPASASGFGDIRVNARFLTDRMAFELHLSTDQYNDLYEINYDFLTGINPYIARIAVADANAVDLYYRYLDIRNDDLRWVLSNAEYARFITLDYFFRPVYTLNSVCYLRIYNVYSNRNHFYFGPPRHYLTYRGGHCRTHFGGRSYYQRIYPTKYRHPVYSHHKPARPHNIHHNFARPNKNPGFHFTPVNRHPGNPNRPNGVKPNKPDRKKPGITPRKPHKGKPNISRPNKPNTSKPGKPNVQRRPNVHQNRKHGKRQEHSAQQSARRNGTKRL